MTTATAFADKSITYFALDDLNLVTPKESNYEWRVKLGGLSWDEATNKSVGFATKLQTKINYQLNQNFNIKLEGGLAFFSDNSQFELTDFGSSDFIFLDEASLNYTILNNLTLSAGSLSQSFLNAPLLISGGRSFPGLRQELAIRKKKYEFGLVGQQLIPTSTAFNDERSEQEELPTFYTGTIFGDYNFNNPFSKLPTAKLNVHAALSYFQFNNLPSIVADRGGLYGHTGFNVGIGPNSSFLYEFKGYLFEPSVSLIDEGNYDITFGGYWADNIEALINDRIQNVYVEGKKTIGNYVVGLKIENFFKDAEASPAVYSSGFYGGNNREGNVYRAELEFTKYKFKLTARYADLNLISENGVQADRQAYYLGVETLYVKF